jgi:UDP:flavonoid glycosyltransferase YjiC (YdhE family)
MKILVAGWDSGGGVEVVQSVVWRAVARGHKVRVLGTEGLRSRFESAGATFLRYRYAPDNDMTQPETDLVKDWQTRNPLSQWRRVRDRQLCGPAREFCRDVAEELRREAADVAVVDTMIPAAMFGAEVSGVPAVIVMHGPYLIPRPGIPPLGTGLMPARGPLRAAARPVRCGGRARGLPQRDAALNRTRAEVGLPPVPDLPGLMARADRILVCSAPATTSGPARS